MEGAAGRHFKVAGTRDRGSWAGLGRGTGGHRGHVGSSEVESGGAFRGHVGSSEVEFGGAFRLARVSIGDVHSQSTFGYPKQYKIL